MSETGDTDYSLTGFSRHLHGICMAPACGFHTSESSDDNTSVVWEMDFVDKLLQQPTG